MTQHTNPVLPIAGTLAFVLALILYSEYGKAVLDWADERGWWEHEELTDVRSKSWSVGEYKFCQSVNYDDKIVLTCEEAVPESKVFNVRFQSKVRTNGKKESHERQWRCRKNDGVDPAITCAVNKPAPEV
jgi:hypothetical protein